MEKELNIAAILKDKPVGLQFYSPTFGYIRFNGVHEDKVYFYSEDTNAHSVKQNGKMYDGGECIIFPSRAMRDWEKFVWKKGDVLVSSLGKLCIFEKWANDEYSEFYAKFVTFYYSDEILETEKWSNEKNEGTIKQYISRIEVFNGGKLNLETLEIEKQPEFKDGI